MLGNFKLVAATFRLRHYQLHENTFTQAESQRLL